MAREWTHIHLKLVGSTHSIRYGNKYQVNEVKDAYLTFRIVK